MKLSDIEMKALRFVQENEGMPFKSWLHDDFGFALDDLVNKKLIDWKWANEYIWNLHAGEWCFFLTKKGKKYLGVA